MCCSIHYKVDGLSVAKGVGGRGLLCLVGRVQEVVGTGANALKQYVALNSFVSLRRSSFYTIVPVMPEENNI